MRLYPFLALLLSISTAQANTWIVGPTALGGQFPNVQAAIQAAAPGDTIHVLAGTYPSFVVDKALRIIGESSLTVTIEERTTVPSLVAVRVPSAGTTTVIAGMRLRLNTNQGALATNAFLDVAPCPGSLILHDLYIPKPSAVLGTQGPGLRLDRCAFVQASRMAIVGTNTYEPSHAAVVLQSTLWASDCRFVGDLSASAQPSGDGLLLSGSEFYGAACDLTGGSSILGGIPGGAGLRAVNSTVKLVGVTVLWGSTGTPPGPSIALRSSTLLWSTEVITTGNLDVDATSQVIPLALRYPILGGAPRISLGSTANLELSGAPGRLQFLFASPFVANPPIVIPGVEGATSLDLGSLTLIASAVSGGTSPATVPLSVPAQPAFLGAMVNFQTVANTATPAFSNPWPVVLVR